jgi:TPR repeat protein
MNPRHLTLLALASLLAAAPLLAGDAVDPGTIRFQAERGNGIAQFNLGIAYAQGRGMTADPIEAFVWLSFATENGTGGRDLDNLIGSLTPEQYEAGKRQLEARRPFVASTRNPPRPAAAAPGDRRPT